MASGIDNLKKNLRRAIGPTLAILACVYFAYHAVHGDRGLAALVALQDRVAEAEKQADKIAAQREKWEHRVALMSSKDLDLDMLEERARIMLNVGYARDTVVLMPEGRS